MSQAVLGLSWPENPSSMGNAAMKEDSERVDRRMTSGSTSVARACLHNAPVGG